jgi:hypothetical protein
MRLTKFGKVVENASLGAFFISAIGAVGNLDYQTQAGLSEGQPWVLWVTMVLSGVTFWFIQQLKRN